MAAIRAIQDGDSPPDEKVRLAESALALAPTSARLHLEYGKNLTALGRQPRAEAAFRRGLAGEPDPDTRSWLLARLANSLDPFGAPSEGPCSKTPPLWRTPAQPHRSSDGDHAARSSAG